MAKGHAVWALWVTKVVKRRAPLEIFIKMLGKTASVRNLGPIFLYFM